MQRGTRIALLAGGVAVALVAVVLALRPRPAPDPESRLQAACSGCHAFPPPDVLPRERWRPIIERMAELVGYLPEAYQAPPVGFDVDEAVAWYEGRAPDALPVREAQTRAGPPPLAFRRRSVLLGAGGGPGVATVRRLEPGLVPGFEPSLATPHMANGSLHLFSLERGPQRIGEAGHPVRIAEGDLDGDGRRDLVIADLGNPMPTDEPVGRVVLARNVGDGRFALRPLLGGLGRVADVDVADLDADGDLDLVVAAFGWLRSGGVHVLSNEDPASLRFRAERVSSRPGAVSAVAVDELWPGSGPVIAVAFAQQHEQVSAFRRGPQGWEERVLYRAPHPGWGTSHLEAVDLDGDADTDFLLAHGDTLDAGIAFKFYHGVEWLENRGGDFALRPIGALYGAHAAEAADLDGDGDLDVVASAFLPQVQLPVPPGAVPVDSVVWFERDGEQWIPWAIESNHPRHTGMTVVDLDGDGRLDVVAAINQAWDLEPGDEGPSLEVWFNEGLRSSPEP